MFFEVFISYLDYFGTAAFALAGVLAARYRQLDLFGVIIVGIVTAVGGGTLRDLILDRPIFWINSNEYIWIALSTSILTFYLARIVRFPMYIIELSDAIGLAVFTIIGTKIAIEMNCTPLICVMMGIMTGTFGGALRDIITGNKPMIFHKEIYATAVMVGSIVYVNLAHFIPEWNTMNILISMFSVLSIRLLSIHFHLQLPIFYIEK